jgi:putative transposase
MIAAQLRKRRPKPDATRHLDEVYLKIDGRMVCLWRAVDAEGEVLDVLVQSKCNKRAALKLMRKLLRKYAVAPERLVTDDLRGEARDKWLVRASIARRCGSPRRSRTEAACNSDQNFARRIARRR